MRRTMLPSDDRKQRTSRTPSMPSAYARKVTFPTCAASELRQVLHRVCDPSQQIPSADRHGRDQDRCRTKSAAPDGYATIDAKAGWRQARPRCLQSSRMPMHFALESKSVRSQECPRRPRARWPDACRPVMGKQCGTAQRSPRMRPRARASRCSPCAPCWPLASTRARPA